MAKKSRIPAKIRNEVFARFNCCAACGTWDAREAGHLVSEANGGAMVLENFVREALREVADPEEALLAYENCRLPKTSSIVIANRGNGPEQCMQLAEERAPNGFAKLEDVFLPGELRAIADRYKVVTGLKRN